MLNNTMFSRTIACGTRSTRKSSKAILTKSLSHDRGGDQKAKKKNKERKKRHSFSFGFFSDKTSSKDSSDKKQKFSETANENRLRSSFTTQMEHQSSELARTCKYHRNSSFEKAAMFGQLEELSVANGSLFQTGRCSSSRTGVESTLIPRILINGQEWDGLIRNGIYEYTEIPYDDDDDRGEIKKIISPTTATRIEECMAGGMGLSEGFVDTENTFFIETDAPFDKGKLKVDIKGPKQNPIKINTFLLDENLCSFSYWPRRVGYYLISIQWGGEHIAGSPFDVGIMLKKPAPNQRQTNKKNKN